MRTLLLFFSSIYTFTTVAQELKSPSDFLGYELGTRFTRHHRVVDYYQYLAETQGENVKLQVYGETNEGRPLLLVYLSSETNIQNIETIRQEHLQNIEGSGNPTKAIVWMSYNVHGNESVSTEASMQTVYELLTQRSEYLQNTLIIIDPCVNPDGRDRYVNWYNQFKNNPYQVDPNSKEHHEPWLNGRANHYMFDLNRDWAWLTQKESQQRITVYNKWLPHVHVDFHEQPIDNPYYFAPAAEPFHEVITDFQREFQVTVGKNHAKYFDANGWFYFTKEVYDLLYPSYGDTYPTYNGSIGMTYEQGGSGRAGLGIITGIGDTLTLMDRIAHHHTTGLSTVEISSKNAERLNEELRRFYQNKNYTYKSYVLNGDKDKIKALTDLLAQHEIEFGLAKAGNAKGFSYQSGKSGNLKTSENTLVVSTDQKKGTLVKVLFEPNAKLSDSLTYDITAWSLPYAYGLDAVASETKINATIARDGSIINPQKKNKIPEATYAFLSDWNSFNDAQFLADLLKADIRVRYAKKPFIIDSQKYERGSLIITKSDNAATPDFLNRLTEIEDKHQKTLQATTTGFVEGGKDFGSSSVQMVKNINIALLSGEPTSTLRFGEIWHFFEQQLHYPITVIDTEYFKQVDLSKYDVFILPDGNDYAKFLDNETIDNLKDWIGNGGKLIAMGSVLKTLSTKKVFSIKNKVVEIDSSLIVPVTAFDQSQREQIKKEITGAIFKTIVDNTHPLAYGYGDSYFSLKLGDAAYENLDNGTVAYLPENNTTPVAGFAGNDAQAKIGETLIFGAENHGDGHIIYMVDNPLFRGFWENGKLFFANALFMVN